MLTCIPSMKRDLMAACYRFVVPPRTNSPHFPAMLSTLQRSSSEACSLFPESCIYGLGLCWKWSWSTLIVVKCGKSIRGQTSVVQPCWHCPGNLDLFERFYLAKEWRALESVPCLECGNNLLKRKLPKTSSPKLRAGCCVNMQPGVAPALQRRCLVYSFWWLSKLSVVISYLWTSLPTVLTPSLCGTICDSHQSLVHMPSPSPVTQCF